MDHSEKDNQIDWAENNALADIVSYFPSGKIGSASAYDLALWLYPEYRNLQINRERDLLAWIENSSADQLFRGAAPWRDAILAFFSALDELLCQTDNQTPEPPSEFVSGNIQRLLSPCFNSDPQTLMTALTATTCRTQNRYLKQLIEALHSHFASILEFGGEIEANLAKKEQAEADSLIPLVNGVNRMASMTEYLVPKNLSEFQRSTYEHLIDWKWKNITKEPGQYAGNDYDAVLPKKYKGKLPHLYEPVRQMFLDHQKRFHFKTHKFADHMASSQIACANLFLPIMVNPEVAPEILASVKPDLASIATEELDNGFRIEFWDEPDNMLGDHNKSTGTDADFAIAYRNHSGQLCLWMIEHKLTEAEFTTCGGARSKGRKNGNYSCDSTSDILNSQELCYYHGKCEYNYWPITLANEATFPRENLLSHDGCPFKGGMNQLWRNTLLALAIENATKGPYAKYQKVFFSVCHHPKNDALNESMTAFRKLLGEKDRFSSFTAEPLVRVARASGDVAVCRWSEWYNDMYLFERQ